MPALAPMRVVGPPPTQPPFGLVNTPGTLIEQSDKHWLGGVAVDSFPVETPDLHYPCSEGSSRIKSVGEDPPAPEFPSFTVYIPITCSGIGIGNEEGAELLRNRARIAFLARESFGVEQALAFGDPDTPADPHLTDANLVDVGLGTNRGPREALSLLEIAIGETAEDGFVHADPGTVVAWFAYGLLEAVGATMKTKRGNTVIVGNGYIGAKPDGSDDLSADQNWAFATGPVRLSRDEVSIQTTADALNRDDNSITFRAERNYVAYWDTALQAGVLVDRSQTP